jgi:hypothetical protein
MYFVAGKSNSHELLDEMLAFGIWLLPVFFLSLRAIFLL